MGEASEGNGGRWKEYLLKEGERTKKPFTLHAVPFNNLLIALVLILLMNWS